MSDLPEPDPIRADARRARHRRPLPPDAACLLCGVSNLDTLLTAPESLFENHHVLGRSADPHLTVVLCRNCHALQSAAQHDHRAVPAPGRERTPDSVLERVARALASLALFVHQLAHTLRTLADALLRCAAGLDLYSPGWREQGWAA